MKRLVIALGLLAAGVGRAEASCPGTAGWVFEDVDAADPFCPNITWMAVHGVTGGCQTLDVTRRLYCPDAPVARDQMAAFMNRLGDQVFQQGGNAFGAAAELGTIDNQPLEGYVNNTRALRLEPAIDAFWGANPNVIGGQAGNSITAGVVGATIAGGGGCNPGTGGTCGVAGANRVTSHFGTVSGGESNTAIDWYATVGGGTNNIASGSNATVGGGNNNRAAGTWATVGGGSNNTAGNSLATVGGGAGNDATGVFATIPGGRFNTAAGQQSFAAGNGANAQFDGCFVWADASDILGFSFNCGGANEVAMRALGGFVFATGRVNNQYVGVTAFAGSGSWTSFSDRHGKDNIERVDGRRVLQQLMAMPIARWNWKTQDARIRHIGPMAQDFHAAFGVGADDRYIETVDADGVALAAIQGLHELLVEQEREITRLKETALRVSALERELEALKAKLSPR